jgi:heme exporter protein A
MRLLATDLACIRGGREVFTGLSFTISAGQALVVMGPNGVGKSSLLRLMAGLVRRTGGTIVLEDGDPELSVAEQAHYLGHQDALKPALTVLENLNFWAQMLDAHAPAIDQALATVGLGSIVDLPAGYLSAGQRRRLSIARLVTIKRPIWLLDEPTTALDTGSQAMLAHLMGEHLKGGGLILAAAHGPIGLTAPAELRLGDQR